jgi:zinc protease
VMQVYPIASGEWWTTSDISELDSLSQPAFSQLETGEPAVVWPSRSSRRAGNAFFWTPTSGGLTSLGTLEESIDSLVASGDPRRFVFRTISGDNGLIDIERVRAQTMAGLRYQMKDPGTQATRRFFAEAFPGHPYGTPTAGTLESLPRIGRDDLIAIHRAQAARERLKVVVVGAIGADEVARRVDHAFGGLPATPDLVATPAVTLSGIGDRHVVEVDVPQSVIRFAVNGLAWKDPDFLPAYVLNHVLGGGASTSRLFQEVREKRGLAYSVGTSLATFRAAAMTWGFTATKNERVKEALEVIGGEIDRLREDGPGEEELEKAKAYLTGSYALGFDTSTKIANQLVQLAFNDLGVDYVARRNALVSAVTAEDVRRAGARMLGDGRLLTVIAGKPEL